MRVTFNEALENLNDGQKLHSYESYEMYIDTYEIQLYLSIKYYYNIPHIQIMLITCVRMI